MNKTHTLSGSLVNIVSIKKCLEYSEDPEKLSVLLSELTVTSELKDVAKYFDGDTDKRIILNITIKRNNREISFTFGMSLSDSVQFFPEKYDFKTKQNILYLHTRKTYREIFNDILYSVLTCVRGEYGIHDLQFEEFCSDFGYDTDSIKGKDIYDKCCEQSRKLKQIFNDEDMDCLPS